MIRALYTTVSGLITQEAKQDVITNNLSNVTTTGFKKDNLIVKKFGDVLIENYDKMDGKRNVRNPIGSLSTGSEIDEVVTDFQQGSIEDTKSSSDFALIGKGFFTVTKEDGKQYLTRDGNFHVSSRGILQTNDGYNVLAKDANGKLGEINVGNGKLTCDNQGGIFVDGQPKGKFCVMDVNDPRTMKKIGDNLYEGQGTETQVIVKQNALEKSNVNVINEMINMMTVMRTFETSQKVMQSIDDTLGKAVNEVGSLR